MAIKYHSNIRLMDNNVLQIGTGSDLRLEHTGSHSNIYNTTGNLNFINYADDSDIIFQSDDGSGGVETYFYLDGSAGGSNPRTVFPDNSRLCIGTGEDLNFSHDATDTYIQNETGDLYIKQRADDKDIIFQSDDGSGGTTTYLTLDGSATTLVTAVPLHIPEYIVHDGDTNTYFGFEGADQWRVVAGGSEKIHINTSRVRFNEDILLLDSHKLNIGSDNDLQLYHDATNSIITNTTGDLYIENGADDKDILFRCDDGSGGLETYFYLDGSNNFSQSLKHIRFVDNASVLVGSGSDLSITHDGTNSVIANSTGNLQINQNVDDGDLILQCDDGSGGTTAYITLDGSTTAIKLAQHTSLADGKALYVGNSNDGAFYHSTNTFLTNATGDFTIVNYADDKDIIFQSDDGSGGVETYFFLDGSASSGNPITIFPDLSALYFGTGTDLLIRHDGTDSTIANNGGDFYITQNTNDKDLILSCDDGSGGNTAYITLDGSNAFTQIHKDFYFLDSVKSYFGSDGDSYIRHTGSNFDIINSTGNINITNNTDDGDIIFKSDDGSGGTITYFKLDGGNAQTEFERNVKFLDTIELRLGTSNDLKLYHDGSNSYIDQVGTGDLYIRNTTDDEAIIFQCDDGSGGVETYFQLEGISGGASPFTVFPDDSVVAFGSSHDLRIYHSGTSTFMSNYVGNFYIDQNLDDGDIVFRCDDGSGGVTAYLTLDGSSGYSKAHKHILYEDDVKAMFGTGGDMQILHDGSNSYISHNVTGHLYIQNNTADADIVFQSDDGSGGTETYFFLDGSSSRTIFPDSKELVFGTDSNLFIFHDGTNSYIQNYTSGDFYIDQRVDDKDIVFRADDGAGSTGEYFRLDGSATSHDGSATTASYTTWKDKSRIALGTSRDMQLYHDGTSSYIQNQTGDLTIINYKDDKDIIFKSDDGSGGTETYFYLDGSLSSGNPFTIFPDSSILGLGSGADVQFYHDGSNMTMINTTGSMAFYQSVDDGDMVFYCDDGSGGLAAYLTLDGSQGFTTAQKQIRFEDSVIASFGNAGDFYISHNGSYTSLMEQTGDLYISNSTDDGDIIFRSDDGSGGLAEYFRLDGGVTQTIFSQNTLHSDSVEAIFGTGSDLKIHHDGSNSYVRNFTGDLYIRNTVDDKDIILESDDGSGGTTAYMTLDGSAGHITVQKEMQFEDSVFARFGTGSDFKIYHNGSTTFLENNTGDLQITNFGDDKDIIFKTDDGSGGTTPYLSIDGSVEKVIVNKPSQRTFAKSSTTDGDANGDIVYFGGTTSMTTGAIYHYKSDGTWELADADAASTCDGLLGVALGSASDTNGVLLRGMVTLDHDPGAVGDVLFLSTTAGDCSATAPSGNGDIVRVIGYCLDASNGQIYFNPDGTFVEVSA